MAPPHIWIRILKRLNTKFLIILQTCDLLENTLEMVEFSTHWLMKICHFNSVLESTHGFPDFGTFRIGWEFYHCVRLCWRIEWFCNSKVVRMRNGRSNWLSCHYCVQQTFSRDFKCSWWHLVSREWRSKLRVMLTIRWHCRKHRKIKETSTAGNIRTAVFWT